MTFEMTRAAPPLGPVVVLGVDGDERVAGFDAALRGAGLPAARVLDWRRFLADPEGTLPPLFPEGTGMLRIESPGGCADVHRALEEAVLDDVDGLASEEPAHACRIVSQAFVVAGLVAAARTAHALAPAGVTRLNDPDAIALFYDKRSCHAFMQARGFPVPRALPPVRGFDELVAAMRARHIGRVFVKPRWGSGAAGVVALALREHGLVAYAAAESRGTALYATRKVRRLEGAAAAALVDAVLGQEAHVEQWAPKAAIDGHACDLRILAVDGDVAHAVLRASPHAITNLDLGARRAAPELLAGKVAPAVWQAMLDDCRRFAALFPKAFHVAFDVAILAGLRRHVFFEVNAFGDLLRRVRHQGLDPYEWQVARLLARADARQPESLPA